MLTASLARDEPSIKRPLSLAPRSLHQLSRPPSPCSPVCRQCGGCSFPQDPPAAASGGDREPPPFPKTELCAGPAAPAFSLSQNGWTAAAHLVREPGVWAGSPGLVLPDAETRRAWEEKKTQQVWKLCICRHGQRWNGQDLFSLLASLFRWHSPR